MRKPNSKLVRKQNRLSEEQEIELLNSWIEAQKPDCGTNPMSLPPLPSTARIGRIDSGAGKPSDFSRYSGVKLFEQLPLSQKTKDGLRQSNFVEMTDVQRAALPHALCGRDIRGAAKTGSGKTLSFVVPVLEKLYRERYSAECGVGSIILSPTRELADQIFEVLKSVGRHHNFSAGLLIGGRKDVDVEKEHVNDMNILVCTPGRLLQHMDETVNFDCSQLQVLVLDEADRVLDTNFKKQVNAVISQLPKQRQTFLFSATQTKSVQDLARLSLRDPEYISVHEESRTATPANLQQTVMIVPLEEKMDMLWSFIKNHLNSKILVFFSTRKQVMFAFEAFKKLTPGIPLKCLHGKMKQIKRMTVYTQFCEDKRSVLFCTDVGSRGLDFNKGVNWVVQVDCPEDVKAYIHRVGRTARYNSVGRSVMFIIPSEIEMLTKLEAQKINIRKIKANAEKMQAVSGLLAALLVKYPDLKSKAEKALLTYLRSVHKNKDKEIFDVTKLPVDQYSASLGLPITPRIRFLNKKGNANKTVGNSDSPEPENSDEEDEFKTHDDDDDDDDINDFKGETVKKTPLFGDDSTDEEGPEPKVSDVVPVARVPKKKKLKINIHRPIGTRVVFDDEGNTLPPLAAIANTTKAGDKVKLDPDKKQEHYNAMREEMKRADKEDKVLDRNRRREKKLKEKLKRMRKDDEEEEDESEGYDNGKKGNTRRNKRTKIASDSEGEEDADSKAGFVADKISLAEQEALALKLLSSMNE